MDFRERISHRLRSHAGERTCSAPVSLYQRIFDLPESLVRTPPGPTLFLCAELLPDRCRISTLGDGTPWSASYGPDVYAQIFGGAHPAQAVHAGRFRRELAFSAESERGSR